MHLKRAALVSCGALVTLASYWIMRGQKKPKHCVFCHPLDRVVYEDDELIAFHDIKPDAKLHLLVIPREHFGTVKELTSGDIPMVKRMHELGQRLLREQGFEGENTRFGFHRPPFNSIHHLHMHCLGLPFKRKHSGKMFPAEGARWFYPVPQLLDQLEQD